MKNILCTIGNFTQDAKEILETIGNVTYADLAQEDLAEAVKNTEVLVVQLGRNITADVIDAAPHLKVIATATTGLDHIDGAHAKGKGISVISLKGETAFLESIPSTAELALGLMISLVRTIPRAHNAVLQHTWDRESFRGNTLKGKTLGIIGYGRLGTMMARYATSLDMHVIYTDPQKKGGVSAEELYKSSDIISIHTHLDATTMNSIGSEEFALMKKGVRIINTARGKIINEEELLLALKAGTIGGYATDVLADELHFHETGVKSALIAYAKEHDNVIITPHIGGTTVESREATDVFIAQKLAKHL